MSNGVLTATAWRTQLVCAPLALHGGGIVRPHPTGRGNQCEQRAWELRRSRAGASGPGEASRGPSRGPPMAPRTGASRWHPTGPDGMIHTLSSLFPEESGTPRGPLASGADVAVWLRDLASPVLSYHGAYAASMAILKYGIAGPSPLDALAGAPGLACDLASPARCERETGVGD